MFQIRFISVDKTKKQKFVTNNYNSWMFLFFKHAVRLWAAIVTNCEEKVNKDEDTTEKYKVHIWGTT